MWMSSTVSVRDVKSEKASALPLSLPATVAHFAVLLADVVLLLGSFPDFVITVVGESSIPVDKVVLLCLLCVDSRSILCAT